MSQRPPRRMPGPPTWQPWRIETTTLNSTDREYIEMLEESDCSSGYREVVPVIRTRCAYCGSTAPPHADGGCHGCGARVRT